MKKETLPFGEETRSNRGFEVVRFQDTYKQGCNLIESSKAVFENKDGSVDDPLGWIWLGLNDVKPQIMKSDAVAMGMAVPPGEVSGWIDYPLPKQVFLNASMHLNEEQVKGLVARLNLWLKTGSLHYKTT